MKPEQQPTMATDEGGQSPSRESAQPKGSAQYGADPVNDLHSLWQQLNLCQQRFLAWADSTTELFSLELKTSLAAIRQMIVLQLLLICLAVFFVLSLCAGVGLVVYHFTLSLLAGYAGFVVALGVVLAGLIWQQARLASLVGFRHTVAQVKEGWDVVSKQTPSGD